MFLSSIKQEIDFEVELANKKEADEKKINSLIETVSKLKMEYDNIEGALCQKKDSAFMDCFTKEMETNGLVRIDEDARYTGQCTYYKYKERILIMTIFPKLMRTRRLSIGLNSKAKVSCMIENSRDNKNDGDIIEFDIWFWIKNRNHRDNYSDEKTEGYYTTQIKQLTDDIESVKKINVETDVDVRIKYEDRHIYSGASCIDAVESICNEVNNKIYSIKNK